MPRPDAKRTELAADKTNICEINVAGYDITDHVSDEPLPQFVRRYNQAKEIIALGIGQQQTFVAAQHSAVE